MKNIRNSILAILCLFVTANSYTIETVKKYLSKPVTVYNTSGRPVYFALVKTAKGSNYKTIKKVGTYAWIYGVPEALQSGESKTFNNFTIDTGYDRVLYVTSSSSKTRGDVILARALAAGKFPQTTVGTGLVKVGSDQHIVIKAGKTDDKFTFSTSKPKGNFLQGEFEMSPMKERA